MKKINNKKGFTLFEMIMALAILTILMSPLPKMLGTVINYQIKEDTRNLSDINEMFTEMERDFLYLNGHSLDVGNNGFDGKENFNYSLDARKNYKDIYGGTQNYYYYPLTNKTITIKTFYGCIINYNYIVDGTTNLGVFKKNINFNPPNINCGRELSVDNIKTLELNKIENIVVFDLKITKDWDVDNNFTQFVKISPFM